jgi:hypothetical protein
VKFTATDDNRFDYHRPFIASLRFTSVKIFAWQPRAAFLKMISALDTSVDAKAIRS